MFSIDKAEQIAVGSYQTEFFFPPGAQLFLTPGAVNVIQHRGLYRQKRELGQAWKRLL